MVVTVLIRWFGLLHSWAKRIVTGKRVSLGFDAYLDIETTSLSALDDDITVIGIYLVNGTGSRLVQLVGEEVTRDNLVSALKDVTAMYTYNGSRFDLPFIKASLGINLESEFDHHDLMVTNMGYGQIDRYLANCLLPHLKAEFSELALIAKWQDVLRRESAEKVPPRLELVSKRKTFEGTCPVCQSWERR